MAGEYTAPPAQAVQPQTAPLQPTLLDAPATLTRFINHRLFRLMMLPARGGMRVLNVAAQPILRTIARRAPSLGMTVAFERGLADVAGEGELIEDGSTVDALITLEPDNLAVLLERTRLAAKRSDLSALGDSVARLGECADRRIEDVVGAAASCDA